MSLVDLGVSEFEKRLEKRGLEKSTKDKYAQLVESAGDRNLLTWIQEKVNSNTSIGTLLPMRAAVKHYLIAEMGYDADEVDSLLPKVQGSESVTRTALSPTQLATYHAAVERSVPEPAKTMLSLLPMTGLKISEMCLLKLEDLHLRGDKKYIEVKGQNGTARAVVLNKSAVGLLLRYLEKHQPKNLLFDISPHGIRKYTRRMGVEYRDLSAVSPEVLRVTYAVMALKQGIDLVSLQRTLGHQNLATTRRYLDQVV